MADSERERLLIVDERDVVVGEEETGKCHGREGILHRGFLAMVFSRTGEVLLTRRSDKKILWPGFWDGTVAGHVMKGEDYVQASRRRLSEELGIITENIEYGFTFRYRADYEKTGTEHEICGVTMVRGVERGDLSPDSNEISEFRYADLKALIDELRENGGYYTPWLVLALEHISERPILERRNDEIHTRIPC